MRAGKPSRGRGAFYRGSARGSTHPLGGGVPAEAGPPPGSVQNAPGPRAPAAKGGGGAGKGTGVERVQGMGKGGYASPAAQAVMRVTPWAAGWSENPVYCDKPSSAEQLAIINQHRNDGHSCVYLSLLSFHMAGMDRRFFEQPWGEVPVAHLGKVIGTYARMCRVQVTVHLANLEGKLEAQAVYGGQGCRVYRHVAIVPTGDGGNHCVPLGKPKPDAVVQLPATVLADMRGDAPEPQPPAAEVVEDVPIPPTVALVATEEDQESEDEFFDAVSTLKDGSVPQVPAVEIAPPEEEGWVLTAFAEAKKLLDKKTYRGIQPPLQCDEHVGVSWRGGWFPSQCPEDPAIVSSAVLNFLGAVDLASATLDNFKMFGTQPVYCDVRFVEGLQKGGPRTVTDGYTSEEFFTAGDSLHLDGASWVVRRVGQGMLKVEATTLVARLRSGFAMSWARSEVRVHATANALTDESREKALWAVACLTNKNPVETAILNRMRGDAANDGFKGSDACSSADLARVIASRYRSAGNVGGTYGWGGCYSCGGALVGKLKQRCCKACDHKNTVLAQFIADGCKVTSGEAPLRYPGIVWTKSRHPPLKKGVQTVATGVNFRTPHHC